jgi:hypothetical protein
MKSQFLRAAAILMLMTAVLLPLTLAQTTKLLSSPTAPKTTDESPAVAQLKHLPTQEEAAQQAKNQAQAGGIQAFLHQSTLIDDAVYDARANEIKAIASGHSELVAPEDLESCKQAIMLDTKTRAEDTAKNAAVERNYNATQALLEKYHCGSYVHIGITERCVFILMGGPLHINDDELAGMTQLVYDHGYIYIDKNGRVENIQSSH